MKLSFFQQLFKQTPTVPNPQSNNKLTEIDQLFRQGLDNAQITPPDNWNAIESQLHAHSWLDKHLWRLSLAAILVLMIAMLYFFCNHVKKSEEGPVAIEQTDSQYISHDKEFISKGARGKTGTELKKQSRQKPHHKSSKLSRLERLYSALMSEPNEFENDIDKDRILSSIQPLQRLPLEELAYIIPELPQPKQPVVRKNIEPELTISIPLQIIESAAEAEQLIQLYDEAEVKRKTQISG